MTLTDLYDASDTAHLRILRFNKHYYGTVVFGDKSVDVTYRISAAMAARFTSQDQDFTYSENDVSSRFESKTALITAAILTVKRKFPMAQRLMRESFSSPTPPLWNKDIES